LRSDARLAWDRLRETHEARGKIAIPVWLNAPYVGLHSDHPLGLKSFHLVDGNVLIMDDHWCGTNEQEVKNSYPELRSEDRSTAIKKKGERMEAVVDIVRAAERLKPEDFLKLRTALDRVEEKLWDRELRRASAKHRKRNLSDAKIDQMVMKRRYGGGRP
jgi:hypothetical protein